MAGGVIMLIAHVERYILLRQSLGFKLSKVSKYLRSFALFAAKKGDSHIRSGTARDWAELGSSPDCRRVRLQCVVHLARFLHAEDSNHEVPINQFHSPRRRTLPYIYEQDEISRIIEAARHLRESYPLRRKVYATLIGIISATGLRISEALGLRLCDILPGNVLQIRCTKFGKSRLVPLHPTAALALARYLEARKRLCVTDDHVFLSIKNQQICYRIANYTFHRLCRIAGIAPAQMRHPRIHDLRHTMATRALEKCPTTREAVARHFVALATYLGHADIKSTYWYLEATPELMKNIATAVETLFAKENNI